MGTVSRAEPLAIRHSSFVIRKAWDCRNASYQKLRCAHRTPRRAWLFNKLCLLRHAAAI